MLLKNKLYFIGIILSLFISLQGCNKVWDDHYNTLDETSQKAKIISELEQIPEISKFTEAVKQIDTLVALLGQNRLYTVFAPTNEAFDAIDPYIINNKVLFERLMLNHFINGKFKYKDFTSRTVSAFNKKILTISVDASRKVSINGNVSIVRSDFLSQNGMIQVIDKPLVPLSNLYEYYAYNKYSQEFGKAIPHFDIKTFLIKLSRPTGQKNENNQMIYDSVFSAINPFLYEGNEVTSENLYGTNFQFTNIANEDIPFTFVFPVNFDAVLAKLKESSALNKPIADYLWTAPLLTNYLYNGLYSKDDIITAVDDYHAAPKVEPVPVKLYLAEKLRNDYKGVEELSNGQVHLVDNFEYDMGWLITDQGNNKVLTKEDDYHRYLIANCTYSANVDTVIRITKHVKTVFYDGTDPEGYNSKYNEWVNFELEGNFFPVDYSILVRGKNTNSGTFKIEVDGVEIGQYDFSTSPSGALDSKFDEIGIVSFNEIKSSTNLKFTFINTHPGDNKLEQLLWIREIKFSPIIN